MISMQRISIAMVVYKRAMGGQGTVSVDLVYLWTSSPPLSLPAQQMSLHETQVGELEACKGVKTAGKHASKNTLPTTRRFQCSFYQLGQYDRCFIHTSYVLCFTLTLLRTHPASHIIDFVVRTLLRIQLISYIACFATRSSAVRLPQVVQARERAAHIFGEGAGEGPLRLGKNPAGLQYSHGSQVRF